MSLVSSPETALPAAVGAECGVKWWNAATRRTWGKMVQGYRTRPSQSVRVFEWGLCHSRSR